MGHEAYSCDTQEPSGGHPEWHIKGDALEAVKGGVIVTMDGKAHEVGKWDLLIAHPPCTYLTVASVVWLFDHEGKIKDYARMEKGWQARAFFMALYEADIPHIAVENPVPLKCFALPAYIQRIEPYFFGDPWKKRTCLWLKGLPELKLTQVVEPIGSWAPGFRDQKKGLRLSRVSPGRWRNSGGGYSTWTLKTCCARASQLPRRECIGRRK